MLGVNQALLVSQSLSQLLVGPYWVAGKLTYISVMTVEITNDVVGQLTIQQHALMNRSCKRFPPPTHPLTAVVRTNMVSAHCATYSVEKVLYYIVSDLVKDFHHEPALWRQWWELMWCVSSLCSILCGRGLKEDFHHKATSDVARTNDEEWLCRIFCGKGLIWFSNRRLSPLWWYLMAVTQSNDVGVAANYATYSVGKGLI